jgi:23S rRNA (cytosine1962-C5)-methyltransferase
VPVLPCLLFEDDHLLVVAKPAGLNTHSPAPYAGEGLYDWLRNREPRWANLAIIHRLDKETSGVLVFGKTPLANQSLTAQFTGRTVQKRYLLLTDRLVPKESLAVKSSLVRSGEKYLSRPVTGTLPVAETVFEPAPDHSLGTLDGVRNVSVLQARPLTGRTHQIRVHAADKGFPILGDVLYGGTAATRLYLHAVEVSFEHPASGEPLTFTAPADFRAEPRQALRAALIEPELTDAFRLIHGASDGWPGWYVEKLGHFLLSQGEGAPTPEQQLHLDSFAAAGVYHKTFVRRVRQASAAEVSPKPLRGESAPERFHVLENGVRFELSFSEGYSAGLFLDQRDNRRKLLTGQVAPGFALPAGPAELLNTFAYTCGFSVCAARAGLRTTSLDLSKKYLEWGRRNFEANQIDPAGHNFIFGDAFDWLRRLAKKGRGFDVLLVDPPTFSQSKQSGVFRVEKDFTRLVRAALAVLKPGGVLFASSNAAGWASEEFLAAVELAVRAEKRKVLQQHYQPQPPDFPISRGEPAYLKTVWFRVG